MTTIDGKDWLVVDLSKFRIPLDWDASSNMFLAIAVPDGGYGNLPFLLKGDPGDTPTLDETINYTPLEYDDPTSDSATWTPLGDNDYQLNLSLHKGPPGADGTSTLDLSAYGTPIAKKILVVNPTADGFVYQSQKVGDRYIPATLNSTPAGNPNYTLGVVSIPAQDNDWRPDPVAQSIITGTGANVAVDLIARIADPVAGNIVGRAFGIAGQAARNQILVPGPPAGAADSYDKVPAGTPATVYLRAERQSGTDTFITSAATTSYGVRVAFVP